MRMRSPSKIEGDMELPRTTLKLNRWPYSTSRTIEMRALQDDRVLRPLSLGTVGCGATSTPQGTSSRVASGSHSGAVFGTGRTAGTSRIHSLMPGFSVSSRDETSCSGDITRRYRARRPALFSWKEGSPRRCAGSPLSLSSSHFVQGIQTTVIACVVFMPVMH